MIVELFSVAAVLIGGCALLRTAGITGWGLLPLGFLAGLALQIAIGAVQVITPLPTAPALTLVLTAGLPGAWWLARWWRRRDLAISPLAAGGALAAVALTVAALRSANLVNWHTDTFRYLMIGRLLAAEKYGEVASENLYTKRLLAVPLIHAPANLVDEYYLRSVTPLLAAATVAALVWFFREGLRRRINPAPLAVFAGLGALLLLTTNRFVFHAFYLNGHLLFAALVLMIAGSGWLLVTTDRVPARASMILQLVAIPAVVVTRPEGSLVAILALLPALLSPQVPLRHRMWLLATLGATVTAWQSYVAVQLHGSGAGVPASVWGELALGVTMLLPLALLRSPLITRRRFGLLWMVEGGLWLALLAFTLREPKVLRDSVSATIRNVVLGAGSWGLSLVMLGALVLLALLLLRAPGLEFLRFPLTTFIPLAFLLAYVREAAYRVGDGDSLNRMLIQVAPLAVLYLVVALASGTWRLSPWPGRRPREDARPREGATALPVRGTGKDPIPPRVNPMFE